MDIDSIVSGADAIWVYLRIVIIQPAFWIPVGGPALCNIFLGNLMMSSADPTGRIKPVLMDDDFLAYFDYTIQYYTFLISFVAFGFFIFSEAIHYEGTRYENMFNIAAVVVLFLGVVFAFFLRFADEKFAALYKGRFGIGRFPPMKSPITWCRVAIIIFAIMFVYFIVEYPPIDVTAS